tara:strand:+ start:427 stop:639 length:213 start_codon:yes stop_codon:yes gene_type:complete
MKKIAILAMGVVIGYSITTSKYNNISNKLDMIIENSYKGKIDSLQLEIMDIGWKLDSMTLKYEHEWVFTN